MSKPLNEMQVAQRLGSSVGLVRKYRYGEIPDGPPWYKVGASCKYDSDDLERWIAERKAEARARMEGEAA